MADWYYAIDGQQHGPVSDRQLHDLAGEGAIQPTDLVWRDGFVDWSEASTVSGLFPTGAPVPPPAPAFGGGDPHLDETLTGSPVDPGNPYASQPAAAYGMDSFRTPDELKIPLLISAISNCAIGALWALTCFGLVLALPMGLLAWNEVKLYKKVDKIPNDQFGADAKSIAFWQIVAGVLTANIPSLVCGILLMIKGGEYERRGALV